MPTDVPTGPPLPGSGSFPPPSPPTGADNSPVTPLGPPGYPPPVAPAASFGDRERRIVGAVLGSFAIVVVVVVAIAAMGVHRLPAFVSLEDHPNLALHGTVAYLHSDGPDGWCATVVDASGAHRKDLLCDEWSASPVDLRWTDDGQVLIELSRSYQAETTAKLIDPTSGSVTDVTGSGIDTPPAGPTRKRSADGAQIRVDDSHGTARIDVVDADGSVHPLLVAEGPEDYRFTDPEWAPDDRFIVVRDSADRLLVVPTDGSPPGVLATDLGYQRDVALSWAG